MRVGHTTGPSARGPGPWDRVAGSPSAQNGRTASPQKGSRSTGSACQSAWRSWVRSGRTALPRQVDLVHMAHAWRVAGQFPTPGTVTRLDAVPRRPAGGVRDPCSSSIAWSEAAGPIAGTLRRAAARGGPPLGAPGHNRGPLERTERGGDERRPPRAHTIRARAPVGSRVGRPWTAAALRCASEPRMTVGRCWCLMLGAPSTSARSLPARGSVGRFPGRPVPLRGGIPGFYRYQPCWKKIQGGPPRCLFRVLRRIREPFLCKSRTSTSADSDHRRLLRRRLPSNCSCARRALQYRVASLLFASVASTPWPPAGD